MKPKSFSIVADKAEARTRLEIVFEQVDRYGDEKQIDSDVADKEIDAAVEAIRSRLD